MRVVAIIIREVLVPDDVKEGRVCSSAFGPPPKTGKLGNRARWDRIGPEYKYQANSHDSGRKSPTEPQIHETKNGKNTHEPKKRTVATATITHSKCTEQHTTRSTPDLTKRKTDTHNTVSTRHKKDPNPSRNANTRTRTKKTTNALPKRLAKTLKKVGALVLGTADESHYTKWTERTRQHGKRIECPSMFELARENKPEGKRTNAHENHDKPKESRKRPNTPTNIHE